MKTITYKSLNLGVWAFAIGILLIVCNMSVQGKSDTHRLKQTDIVAGTGEHTFSETYGFPLILPMAEEKFVTQLDRHKLYHDSCGVKGVGVGLPVPRHTPTVDLSRAQKCIEIIGEIDSVRHIGKRYRAYVDGADQVFYIENAFSYTGP